MRKRSKKLSNCSNGGGRLAAGVALAAIQFFAARDFTMAQTIPAIPMPPVFEFLDENGVDLSTASYRYQLTEASIGSGPGQIELNRYYSTAEGWTSLAVDGWSTNWDSVVAYFQISNNQLQWAKVSNGNQTKIFLLSNINGPLISHDGDGSSLVYQGDGYLRFTDRSGGYIDFRPPPGWTGNSAGMCNNSTFASCIAFAQQKKSPNGTIYTFEWEKYQLNGGQGARLIKVTSNTGYEIQAQYLTNSLNNYYDWYRKNSHQLQNLNFPNFPSTTVTYSQEIQQNGSTFTNPKTFITTLPSGKRIKYIYNVDFINDIASFSFENLDNPINNNTMVNYFKGANDAYYFGTFVRNGIITGYDSTYFTTPSVTTLTGVARYDSDGVMTISIIGNGNVTYPSKVISTIGAITEFKYDVFGRVTEIKRPNLNVEKMTYDDRGNLLTLTTDPAPGSNVSSLVRSAIYPTNCSNAVTCNKPLSVTDAKGAITNFTYAPEHGGVLTETGPATTTGIRPQTRYQYAQREAVLRTSTGNYAPTGQPIWLLVRKSFCKTTAAQGAGCTGGVSDEQVTAYDYGPTSGPNNLQLRGIVEDENGAALRTCYTYDAIGNRVGVTKPKAGLGSCS